MVIKRCKDLGESIRPPARGSNELVMEALFCLVCQRRVAYFAVIITFGLSVSSRTYRE